LLKKNKKIKKYKIKKLAKHHRAKTMILKGQDRQVLQQFPKAILLKEETQIREIL
jgi:hypothetical protein